MNSKYLTTKREIIHANPYWSYVIEDYILPNSTIGKYYYVDSIGSTIIIPQLSDGKFVMTQQYRYLNKKFSIEFPGGGIKKGLTPEINAFEELRQETGFVANNLKLLGEFNPCNGMTNEICWVFLAEGLKNDVQKLDETEEIEVLLLSSNEILDNIKKGAIWDGMTLASWSLFYFYQS
ncbi:MAG: NUDIX hydrolase [Candidatus Kapaibacteriales bacterium]